MDSGHGSCMELRTHGEISQRTFGEGNWQIDTFLPRNKQSSMSATLRREMECIVTRERKKPGTGGKAR